MKNLIFPLILLLSFTLTINTVENQVFIPSAVLALKLAEALEVSVEEAFYLIKP